MSNKEQNSQQPLGREASAHERLVMCYRCGYCGQPTDPIGNPISIDEINELAELVDWDKADKTHGACCQQGHERNMVQVSREMAMDAQDMSLEGQWIEW